MEEFIHPLVFFPGYYPKRRTYTEAAKVATDKGLRAVLARRLDELMRATPGCETQLALSKRSGVGQTTIGRMLAGKTGVTLDNLEAVAYALGVSPSDLLHTGPVSLPSEFRPAEWSALPAEGRARIAAFVQFTVNEYARENPERFSTFTERPAPQGAAAQLERAATRPPTTTRNEEEPQRLYPARRSRGRPRKDAA